jgi:hypothetical protein
MKQVFGIQIAKQKHYQRYEPAQRQYRRLYGPGGHNTLEPVHKFDSALLWSLLKGK